MWRRLSDIVVVSVLIVATPLAQQPAPAADTPETPGTLIATASLSRHEAAVGDAVRFWVTIRNGASTPIANVRIARIDAPEFTSTIGPMTLREVMAPGEQVSVSGDLSATKSVTNRTPFLLLQWQAAGGPVQALAVPLGALTATRWYVRGTQAVIEFVKDIALPLVLALLGYWFQRWEHDRAERVARAERERSEMLQREEQARAERLAVEERERTERVAIESQRRTEIGETWRQMLPVGHTYAITYYMPVVAAGATAVLRTRQARRGSDPWEWKRAFHLWVLFGRRCRAQMDDLNGWYFKDRCGEEFAAALHGRYQELYFGRPGTRDRIDVVLSAVEPRGPGSRRPAFLEKWDSDEARATIPGSVIDAEYQEFLKWAGGDDVLVVMHVVEAFVTVVNFEMNRLYEPWYGKSEKMRLGAEPAAVVWAQVQTIAKNGSVSEKELEGYLAAQGIVRPDVTAQG